MRCIHEAQMHSYNSFITFTYNDTHIPADYSLNHDHYQLFMKRLRQTIRREEIFRGIPKEDRVRIRFYMCGEYGGSTQRPHYHSCIFGYRPMDLVFYRNSESGHRLYTSKSLDELWGKGFCQIGDVTKESAGYVARYVMKKRYGRDQESHYEIVDPETGEVHKRKPEYACMSLRPGIGANWLRKYTSDVYPRDYVVVDGVKCKPPRYYDRIMERDNPALFEALQPDRVKSADIRAPDNTVERLKVRETVTLASINKLKRNK